jgi:hypothetical protein
MGLCHSDMILNPMGEKLSLNYGWCKSCCHRFSNGRFKGMLDCENGTFLVFNECPECLRLVRNIRLI